MYLRFEKLIFETKQLPRLFSFAAAMLSNNESNHMHTCQCRPLMGHMKLSSFSRDTSSFKRADSEHIFSRCPQLRSIRQRFDVIFAIVGKRSVEHPWADRDYEVQFSQKSSFHRMFLIKMPGIDPRYLAHANRALYHLSYTPMWANILPKLRIFNIYSLLYCFQQRQCEDEDWSAGHC